MYYRCYITYDFLGYLFNLHNSNICRLFKLLEPIVAKVIHIQKDKNLTEEIVYDNLLIIDTTEQKIQRPSKNQKKYYSGKKKKHNLKTTIAINEKNKINFVSKTYEGSIYDLNILKKEISKMYIQSEDYVIIDNSIELFNNLDTNKQLFCRWIESSVFTPFLRNHSSIGTKKQEPYAFDLETKEISKRYISLRYTFAPYLYKDGKRVYSKILSVTSSNPSVAYTTNTNYVYCKGPGITDITVTLPNGFSVTKTIVVKNKMAFPEITKAIYDDEDNILVKHGVSNSYHLKYPSNVTYYKLKFDYDKSMLSISLKTSTDLIIKGLSVGKTVVKMYYDDGFTYMEKEFVIVIEENPNYNPIFQSNIGMNIFCI